MLRQCQVRAGPGRQRGLRENAESSEAWSCLFMSRYRRETRQTQAVYARRTARTSRPPDVTWAKQLRMPCLPPFPVPPLSLILFRRHSSERVLDSDPLATPVPCGRGVGGQRVAGQAVAGAPGAARAHVPPFRQPQRRPLPRQPQPRRGEPMGAGPAGWGGGRGGSRKLQLVQASPGRTQR